MTDLLTRLRAILRALFGGDDDDHGTPLTMPNLAPVYLRRSK